MRNPLDAPVILVGAPRSGTSFLADVLSHHPDFHCEFEPRLTWRYGNDRKSDVLYHDDAHPRIRAHIRQCFATRVTQAGKKRLLEKHPSNCLRLEFVDAVFPDCKIIHILRNPRSAVGSIAKMWLHASNGLSCIPSVVFRRRLAELRVRQAPYYVGELLRRATPRGIRRRPALWGPRIPGLAELAEMLSVEEVAAIQWRTCVELACHFGRQMDPSRYREVWLEDLTPETVEQLLDFCDAPQSREVLEAFVERYRPGRAQMCGRSHDDRVSRWFETTEQYLRDTSVEYLIGR